MESIFSNPIFNFILGIALFLAGNLFSYVLYKKQMQPKQITWDIKSFKLFSDYARDLNGLRIKYGKRKVHNILVSRIVVWNPGLQPISKEDIASSQFFGITSNQDTELLEARVLATNNSGNQAGYKWQTLGKSKALELHFEYLKPNEGFVLEVIHTGFLEGKEALIVIGDLKNGHIRHRETDTGVIKLLDSLFPISFFWIFVKSEYRKRKIQKTVMTIIAILFLVGVPLLIPFMRFSPPENIDPTLFWALEIRFLLRAIIGFIFYVWVMIKLRTIPIIPNGLESFYEELH